MAASDALFLDAAIDLAHRGLYSTTPNPRVGCVLVRDAAVIGRGWHSRAGGPHAEITAITHAQERHQDIEGATCYVSLEPCAHYGRTPPCADALIAARVERVVVASLDPNPRVAGTGIERMRDAGVRVDVIERPAAIELNRGYLQRMTLGRPWVRLKIATSLDGRAAMASGESRWITSEAARADAHYWRARSCAIVTGVGTVLADDPRLTVRGDDYAVAGVVRQPLRVVVDSTLRTPPSAALFAAPGPVLIATTVDSTGATQALRAVGAEVLEQGGSRIAVTALLAELAARECNEVLFEAGPTLTGELFRLALWDEAIVYLAPKLLGRDARPFADLSVERLADAVGATFVDVKPIGNDLRVRILRIGA